MKVQVKYRGKLAQLAGRESEEVEASRVDEVLRYIKAHYGAEAGREAGRMLVTVDRQSVTLLQDRRTPLREGCTVAFLPVCGGG
jgi:molybdopterin converting factor small subunit